MSNVKIQGSPTGTGNVTLVAPVTNSDITITLPSADGTLASAGSIGDGTLTMNTSGVGLSGSQTFTANQTGNATFTIASNATSVNTVSTVVARDASGNFSAGTITAALSGNSTTSTTATNLAGGSAGTVPYQSAAGTTVQLAAGTSGQLLQSNGAAAPSWVAAPVVNNGTLTMNVSGTGLSGSQTFTANQSGNATFTVTSNATNANTASTIVARDGSGNFSAGTITATLSGNASTASSAAALTATTWQRITGNAIDYGSYGSIGVSGTTNTYAGISFSGVSGTLMMNASASGFYYSNSTWRVYWDGSGNQLNTGNVTAYASDARLKTNVAEIENPLQKLRQIRGVTYDWILEECNKWNFFPPLTDVGVIAQEVQEVQPQAVKFAPFDRDPLDQGLSKSGKEYLTVQYEKLVPLLIEAIKELDAQMQELKQGK